MSTTTFAARVGVRRGWTEFRQYVSTPDGYSFNVFLALIVLVVLFLLRHHTIAGAGLSLATAAIPGVVGMLVAFNTTLNAAFLVATEREDGTLLRAKAAPHGLVGYLAGQVVRVPLITAFSVLFVVVPGLLFFDDFRVASFTGWLSVVWVFALGVLATLPFGLMIGAVARDPRSPAQSFGLMSVVLIAISGIFYPISGMPGWLHPIAQIFPYYWLGLGMRSGLLPPTAATIELGGSWEHWQTAAVLGGWAIAGLLIAPRVLSTAARRESGASVEVGRRKAMQRTG
jgi:ABC-2 type transport system permease protein